MKVVPLDQHTAEDNYHAPDWWINFTQDILPYDFRERAKRRVRIAEWHRDVNTKLLGYGGRLQQKKDGDYLLTFRLDCNYTFFLLKHTYTPKESEFWA